MDDHIQEARRQVFIQPSTSPAASSCCFVGKKDGGLRPCIDYITLNSQTVKLPYPLSLVPAALEELRGACIFSKLDLRNAYNLIRIWESDEYKTAFTTPSGHYEYKVISFGLSNSLSIFQTIMNEVFREFLHRFISMYIDDILIYSRNLAEHCHHVTQVLQQLRQHSLYLNLTRNQNPSSLQPSSSVPSSGTSLRTSVSPLSPNQLRWEAQKGKPMSLHHNVNPFWGSVHNIPGSEHPGSTQTLSLLQVRFWWPSMTRDVFMF